MQKIIDVADYFPFTDTDKEYNSFKAGYEIVKKGGWWSAILLSDTESKRIIHLRKWRKRDDEWKPFRSSYYGINSRKQLEDTIEALQKLLEHM